MITRRLKITLSERIDAGVRFFRAECVVAGYYFRGDGLSRCLAISALKRHVGKAHPEPEE